MCVCVCAHIVDVTQSTIPLERHTSPYTSPQPCPLKFKQLTAQLRSKLFSGSVNPHYTIRFVNERQSGVCLRNVSQDFLSCVFFWELVCMVKLFFFFSELTHALKEISIPGNYCNHCTCWLEDFLYSSESLVGVWEAKEKVEAVYLKSCYTILQSNTSLCWKCLSKTPKV